MITDSYSASCYIENDNGQYHMECEMISDDKEIYADYDGDDFVNGLNEMMSSLTEQMFTEPEPKSEPETLEEKVTRLENLVEQLQKENKELRNSNDNNSNSSNEENQNNYKIDDAIKCLEDNLKNYINDLDLDLDQSKNFKTSTLRWPFKITW